MPWDSYSWCRTWGLGAMACNALGQSTVNPPRGFDQSAMLTSYRVWDYDRLPETVNPPRGFDQSAMLTSYRVASEHRWLVKAPRWIHSVPDVSGRRTLRLPSAIVESPWRHKRVPFVNIASVRSRSIKRRQWQHKMDNYGVVFAHLATGRGINAKDPSGLDSLEVLRESRSG